MADNYEGNQNELIDEYDGLRTTLKTPENLVTDTDLYDITEISTNSCTDSIEPSPNVLCVADINNYECLSNKTNGIPFKREEWQIYDQTLGRHRPPRQNEFLQLLLENSRYSSYVCWLNKSEGLFRILQPELVATLWGQVKCRQTQGKMNYETFARGVRYYYGTGIMTKTNKKYTFCFKE